MSKELEEINKVYKQVQDDFRRMNGYYKRRVLIETKLFIHNIDSSLIRMETIQKLLIPLESVLCMTRIICDEENNISEVVDNNQLVARVEWRINRFDTEIHFVDLYFYIEWANLRM